MTTPPFATVRASINGGAAASGGLTAAFGQTVLLTATNTTGWYSALWEIYDYPTGFSTPSGWTLNATTGAIQYQPSNPTSFPPIFTLPASGANNWGKFAIRLRVNSNPLSRNPDGSPAQGFSSQLTDEATIISVPSPNQSMPGLCFNESTQYDAHRSWAGAIMANLKLLDTIGGGGVTWAGDLAGSTSSSQIVVSLTGSGGAILIGSNAGIMRWVSGTSSPRLDQAGITTASATGQTLTIHAQDSTGTSGVGGAIVVSTGAGASGTTSGPLSLQTGGNTRLSLTDTLASVGLPLALQGTVASAGDIRAQNNSTILAYRNAANSFDLSVLASDGSNNLTVGAGSASVAANATFGSNNWTNTFLRGSSIQIIPNNGSGTLFTQCGTIDFTDSSGSLAIAMGLASASTSSLTWGAGTIPLITQSTTATASATGAKFTIQAQNASGTSSTGGSIELKNGTGTSFNGTLYLTNMITATSATAGANGSLPATVAGYLTVILNGTTQHIPFYA